MMLAQDEKPHFSIYSHLNIDKSS